MEQPAAPAPSSNNTHEWPAQFVVDWKFYFVPDDSDAPPYTPTPKTPYNVTTGRTYYYDNAGKCFSCIVRCSKLTCSSSNRRDWSPKYEGSL